MLKRRGKKSQDLNQDGISQADELTSLDDRQITDINLGSLSVVGTNATVVTDVGNYITADGEVHEVANAVMGVFNPPVNGEVSLTAEEQAQLNQIVTANWNLSV